MSLPNQKIAMASQTASFPCNTTHEEQVMMSSTGTPFEITGFRTEKFENDEDDSSKIDRCSDSPSVMELFQAFRNA